MKNFLKFKKRDKPEPKKFSEQQYKREKTVYRPFRMIGIGAIFGALSLIVVSVCDDHWIEGNSKYHLFLFLRTVFRHSLFYSCTVTSYLRRRALARSIWFWFIRLCQRKNSCWLFLTVRPCSLPLCFALTVSPKQIHSVS
jgi:hypothetical protein